MLEVFEKHPTDQESNEILRIITTYSKNHQQSRKKYVGGCTFATKIEFEDQRFNEVEKIDQRDLFMISNKQISIEHIEFVILDEFMVMGSKIFLFLVLT